MDAQEDTVATLHVYANLVQVPVLVLDSLSQPMANVEDRGFYVSLDGGPRFRVAHARREGDDPISLSILLDLSQPFPKLIERFDEALPGLAPDLLHLQDQVTVYSFNCGLTRSTEILPTDAAGLKTAVDRALEFWNVHGKAKPRDCAKPWHLWDALRTVTRTLQGQPGRHVILVVTDGEDRGSRTSSDALRQFAQENGVTIFALAQPADLLPGIRAGVGSSAQTLNSVCEMSGGIVLTATEKGLESELERFVRLVRGRYVVEFPRPANTTPGRHELEVTIEKTVAFIRPAGASAPLDDEASLKDPMRVPADPASAPVIGRGKHAGGSVAK